ncbi:MAG: polysaccharide deacetylase family protein [Bacteroidales bacterium]|nr:polysaccharide deacetylase family protein [Bacteroidales bacterium]
MKIIIPEYYYNEREYVIKTSFNYLFGESPEIELQDISNYIIILNNGSVIEIEDHFFSKYANSSYLNSEALPSGVKFFYSGFCCEENIPVLYGSPQVIISNEKVRKTVVKIDLIASIFFMLVRWEEYVNPIKDEHGRFPLHESVAYKCLFHKRPVVNEYFEFLWNIIRNSDPSLQRKKREFNFRITHDIDSLFCPNPTIRSLAKILIKKHSLSRFIKTIYYQLLNNPHDSFHYLMDQSERIKARSVFYFMTGNTCALDFEDYLDSVLFKERIKEIIFRGHIIGLHPSYNSYNNAEVLKTEKLKLESITGTEISEVRQHFLRIEQPVTFVNQELCGFNSDSSLGYVEDIGFRCGICNEFPIFDFLSGKQLEMTERPLIVMEGSLIKYKKSKPDEVLNEIKTIIDCVRRHSGSFVFLWHNTSFGKDPWFEYQHIYPVILDYLNGK